MPDYTITLKVRCRKRSILQDIDRIFKTGRFQENLEFSLSEGIIDRLRLAYLDVSEVDVSARFSRKRKAQTGVAASKTVPFTSIQQVKPLARKVAKRTVKAKK